MLNLLKETGKLASKPTNTPIKLNHKLSNNNNVARVDQGNYQRSYREPKFDFLLGPCAR